MLPRPFHVMATSNPVEYEGTYPLPEAQLDRFMVRLAIGYPSRLAEADVLSRRLTRRTEETTIDAVVDPHTVLRMQAGVEAVEVAPDIVTYCVAVAASTRRPPGGRGRRLTPRIAGAAAGGPGARRPVGPGLRLPEDVKEIAVAALAHRITLNPQTWASGLQAADVVATLLDQVPGPTSVGRQMSRQ